MLETYTNPTELTRSRLPGASGLAVDREFEDVLADYGLNRDDANLNELVVPSGSVLRLSDLVKPHLRQSADAADLKRWVGLSDAFIDANPGLEMPEPPARPWTGHTAASLEALSAEQLSDVQRATENYLFGNSKLARSYKPAIEAFYGPFEVALYLIPRIVIEPGARLEVNGRPTALLCEQFIIQAGGALDLKTIARLWIHELEKRTITH